MNQLRNEITMNEVSTLKSGPDHRWIVLGLGIASQLSFAAAFQGIPITGPMMRASYHLTTAGLGIALGAIALGIAVSEIPWGILTDRFGERAVLFTGLVSTAICFVFMALAVVPTDSHVPSLSLLATSLLMVGLLGGSVNGSSGRAVMSWFKDSQRGFAMSIRQTAVPAGGAVGAVVLPWLALNFGFQAVFGVLALFCLLSAGATYLWMRKPAQEPVDFGQIIDLTPVANPLKRWQVWRVAFASLLLTIPQFAILTFAAIYLHDVKHAGPVVASITILCVQFGGAVARVWSGKWTDKHKNRYSYLRSIGTAAGIALMFTSISLNAPVYAVAFSIAVAGVLASAWHGVAYTEIASIAGAKRAGTALGLENTAVFAAAFITPALIPAVINTFSWSAVWLLAGICSLLAVPLLPKGKK